MRYELGVDPVLADAPSDQLGVLPTEVDDQHGTILRLGLRALEGQDLGH
jgi:hypothetical protein